MPKLKPGTLLPTDTEEAAINAALAADPDAVEPSDADFLRLKPVGRGRPRLTDPKRAVKLRLDGDVLDGFRAKGAGWQTAINDALRAALGLPNQR